MKYRNFLSSLMFTTFLLHFAIFVPVTATASVPSSSTVMRHFWDSSEMKRGQSEALPRLPTFFRPRVSRRSWKLVDCLNLGM